MKYSFIPVIIICAFLSCHPKEKGSETKPDSTHTNGMPLTRVDSLLFRLTIAVDDSNKVMLLDDIAWEYEMMGLDTGMSYARQQMELAKKLRWPRGLTIANGTLGLFHMARGEYTIAAEYFQEGLRLNEENGNIEGIAISSLNLGDAWSNVSEYPKALAYLVQSLKSFEALNDTSGMLLACNNISIIYNKQQDHSLALEYLERVRLMAESQGDKNELSGYYTNYGLTNARMKNYDQALEAQQKALEMNKETGNQRGVAGNLHNLGNIRLDQDDLPKALDYYQQALMINSGLNNIDWIGRNLANIGQLYYLAAKGDTPGAQVLLKEKCNADKNIALREAGMYTDSAHAIKKKLGDLDGLSKNYLQKSNIQTLRGQHELALESYKKHDELKDSVFSLEKDKKLTQTTLQYEFDKKEAKARAEQDKKDVIQRNIRNSILAGLLGALFFLVVVYRQRNKIAIAQKRSDELLLNILPEEVAEELKEKGNAKAKQFDEVTVMFTDFKGFTQIAEKLSPTELVNEIHTCFKAFDDITSRHNIEKIKTIGDAYMCAGGLPVTNTTHAVDVVNAGIEIQTFMKNHNELREKRNLPVFEIRIGIHTGTVVAGIVGIKKFAYDIWGDAVNIAARMESSGEAGKVNISGSTYARVKDKFNCMYRGKIQAKNKGDIDMYYVESAS